MTEPPIPQTDPGAGYRAHREELDAAWRRVMGGGRYVLGGEVARFEEEFASYLGARAAVGTGSGTDALFLALRAVGVGPGDDVLTVAHTAVATVAAIVMAQARPVFVDVDPATFTMDPNALEDTIRRAGGTPAREGRFKAVVVVHLYGQPADMPAILDVAGRYDLRVVEDCAQSHGATLGCRKAGTWGDAASFSFYPTKNLGAFGDAGAVVTGNRPVAGRCRALREYGWNEERVSREPGVNSRLDEVQAALLRVKLRYLERDNAVRRALASIYDRRLTGAALTIPVVRPGAEPVYHQYVVRTPGRASLRAALQQAGIGTAVHYSPPVHQHPAFRRYHDPAAQPLPETERAAADVVSLPMYPQLGSENASRVADAILRWTAQHRPGPLG